ncbi:MAG: Hsp20/alpha crystallin family protein, partial [Bacteroidota bacterium]
MKLVRRNHPYFNTFPSLFEEIFKDDFFSTRSGGLHVPAVNVKESDAAFTLEVVAPGRSKEDFKIEVNKDLLTISSKIEDTKEEKDENGKYTRREFTYRSFTRSFTLPETVDGEHIGATYDKGILHLTLPKMEA